MKDTLSAAVPAEFSELRRGYGQDDDVLKNVSFNVMPGEIVALPHHRC